MPVVLVRHTKLAIGPELCYGATDIDVAESFKIDAEAVVDELEACDSLITSPLQRCRKLAEKIAARFGIALEIDERVTEMDFGSWEGREWSRIPKAELDAWAIDFLHARPHGGESVAMLRSRVLAAVEDYQRREGTQVVVCHAGVIKAVFANGDDPCDFSFSPDYGGIFEVHQ